MLSFHLLPALFTVVGICSFTATTSEDGESYRLPLEVIPYSYSIRLVPYLDEGDSARQFTFEGNVSILVRAQCSESSITLHARDLELDGVPIVTEVDSGCILPVSHVTKDSDKDFLILNLMDDLSRGNTYSVDIIYMGELNDNFAGFYRSFYNENGSKRWLASTDFEATNARLAFPCFDEPALKATFNISIARRPEMNSISNMPLQRTTGPDPDLNGRYWDTFHTSVRMSTYLVAFMVSDFKALGSGKYRIWSKPDIVQHGQYALDITPGIVEIMENLTGIPYPLLKMDQVAIPAFRFHGMENWGLIIYHESVLLLRNASEHQSKVITMTMVHEFAHQWFGNLVSPSWWDFIWLNEGFADFFMYYATNMLFPDWKLLEQQVISQFVVMEYDYLNSSAPLTNDVETPEEIEETFNLISYSKGACLLRMMQHALTSRTFFKGIHRYLKARAYSDAVADDLFAGLQEAVDEDGILPDGPMVKTIMDTWTLQEGYPVITVSRNYSDGTAVVYQDEGAFAKMWYVPVSYTTSEELDFNNTTPDFWLTPHSNATLVNLPGKDQWIILNKQVTGYFRVNYDEVNWKLLQAQLNSEEYEKIHPLNRVQLQDDAWYFVEDKLLDIGSALGITRYLERETDPTPWLSGFKQFKQLYYRFAGSPGFSALQGFYLRLLTRLNQTVGFECQEEENILISEVRSILLPFLCLLERAGCLQVLALAEKRIQQSLNDFSPSEELPTFLYCSAVHANAEQSWKWLWKLYKNTNNDGDRRDILAALSCTANRTLQNRLLDMSLLNDSLLYPADKAAIFSVACTGIDESSCNTTLHFVSSHLHQLAEMFGGYENVTNILHKIAESVKTQEQLTHLEEIVLKNKEQLSVAEAEISTMFEFTKENVQLIAKQMSDILNWLSEHVS